MNSRVKQVLAGVLGAVVALVCVQLVRDALAASDGSDATEQVPRVIPWEGTVTLDGAPFDGPLAMRFTLYDDAGKSVWTETWDGTTARIPVVRGAFSALLGTYQNLEAAIADAADLSLGVEVERASTWTALGGRQRLAAAPYGLWAARSSNLQVAGTLSVGGAATVSGDVLASQDVTVGARLALGVGKIGPNGLRLGDSDAGAQLLYRTDPNTLVLELRNDAGDGTDALQLDVASGKLSNTGTTAIHGALAVNGGFEIMTGHDLILGADTTPDAITGAVDEPWLRLGATATSGAVSLYLGDSADTAGISLDYFPSSDTMYIETGLTSGSPAAAASRFMAIRSGHVDIAQNLEVDTDLITSGIDSNYVPDACLKDDGLEKRFKSDSGCIEGAIKIVVDTGANPGNPGLCACFDGASQNQKDTKGWHCFM